MLRENGKRIWDNIDIIITLTIILFLFFFFFESVMLSTYVHILKSTHILQSTNHESLSELYLGKHGARMYIKSIIKS